jgi:hypothetical protein
VVGMARSRRSTTRFFSRLVLRRISVGFLGGFQRVYTRCDRECCLFRTDFLSTNIGSMFQREWIGVLGLVYCSVFVGRTIFVVFFTVFFVVFFVMARFFFLGAVDFLVTILSFVCWNCTWDMAP